VAADDSTAPAASRVATPTTSEKVIIAPSKGGAVSPKAAKQSRALDVRPGTWIWDGVVRVLEVDLFSASWEVRHGAAMALRELLKAQGACGGMRADAPPAENAILHEKWCNDLSAKFLCVFVLDRFGDFVSDQVVAPVRETVSQTLAALLLHMPRRSVGHVHAILLQMIQQDLPAPATNGGLKKAKGAVDAEKTHVWEVRHAGLLGIKYEVAVRSDLFAKKARVKAETAEDAMAVDGQRGIKCEEQKDDIKSDVKREEDDQTSDFDEAGREVLRGVVEAAILGYV
jgi:TATA-binding protein-associated factor